MQQTQTIQALVMCPLCRQDSADADYCSRCSKPLPKSRGPAAGLSDVPVPSQAKEPLGFVPAGFESGGWRSGTLPVLVAPLEADPGLLRKGLDRLRRWIELPFELVQQAGIWTGFFHRDSRQSLPEFLAARAQAGRSPFERATEALLGLFDMFEAIHREGFLLGDLEPEGVDVCGDDAGGLQLKLRLVRELLPMEGRPAGGRSRTTRGYDAPETRNQRPELWSVRTDIHVLGSFLLGALTGRERFVDFEETEHLAHQLRRFCGSAPYELHAWLARSCAPDPEHRFGTVAEQRAAFVAALGHAERRQLTRPSAGTRIRNAHSTRPGRAKLCADDDFRLPTEVNEDRGFVGYGAGGPPRAVGLVADGMTRSTLGSGSLASDLAAKAVAAAWNPAAGTDSAWLERTLTAAHRHIVEKSRTLLAEGPRDGASRLLPMGTTAVLAVVEGNRAVVASVGDSRAYLFDPKFGLMLLTHEHTQANRLLSEGTSWAEVRNREDRATIVSALGSCRLAGDRLQEEPLEVSKAEFTLAPGELLLLCTDGFTDALGRASAKKGRWDAERELERLISELCGRGLSLKQLVEQLASEADARAGDDNITLVAFSLDETPPGAGASTGSEGDNRSRGQTGVRRSRERRAN